jgi:single-stranded-DNA-specific exonuclease
VQALNENRKKDFDDLYQYFDLVALSIAADVVPITLENRTFVHFGLKQINKNPRKGLVELFSYAKILHSQDDKNPLYFNKEITVTDLIFNIAPRINATGRMESGKTAVRLLITQDNSQANEIAAMINLTNDKRRQYDRKATKEAIEMINDNKALIEKKSTVLFNPSWHQGIVGIVASRLIEHYNKPTIIFTKNDDFLVGSARSVGDFDIYSAIVSCSNLLSHFGGHKAAAGLTIKEDLFEEFAARFEQYVSQTINLSQQTSNINIDMEISLADISNKFFRILKRFEPFGNKNHSPIFLTRQLVDTGRAKIVGTNHLKLSVIHPHISSLPIDCIAFGLADKLKKVQSEEFDICYNITKNDYKNKVSLQLNVIDIR